jgi:predicted DNA-binding protein with PD1-like motif
MKIILDTKEKSVIRMDTGEECLEVLTAFAKEKDMSFNFSIIGAASTTTLGYYDLAQKKYFNKEFSPDHLEVLSVTGNVSWYEGTPVVHAHGTFSDENYNAIGGHVNKLVILLTGEATIDWLPEKIIKKDDAETGLKLLSA